tara:strand:- start:749 stop:1588 length:840 start_codon:yes stop_codon:yes gene_type:complete
MKILYPLAKRFIAGHDFDSAKPKIDQLMDEGYEVSIDYLGELSKTIDDCFKASEQYMEIINYYKDKKIDISIKPTQLGLSISQSLAYNLVCDITEEALKYNHTIRLDMEDSTVTQKTIDLCLKVKTLFPNIGIALQSNLFSTEQDLIKLINKNISIRLVKGAYKESEKTAYQNTLDVDSWFFAHAAHLYSEKTNRPAIATHDEELLEDIEELIPDPKYFDYEMLYGIRRDLQKSLLSRGYRVRIYIPFGEDWLPYTLRRLKEWKNLKFVIRNVFKEGFR